MTHDTKLSRRAFLRGVLGLGGIAVLEAACAPVTPSSSPTMAPKATSAAQAGLPKVSFDAKVAISHLKSLVSSAAWAVGEEKGFFKEVGLRQELISYKGGGDTVRGLLTAGNHYGMVTPSATILAFLKGEPIRIIGGAFGGSTVVFIVKKDSPIQSVEDLEGKKIGYSQPGSTSFVLATTLSERHNLNAELVSTGGVGDSLTALRNDLVDCVWTVEPQPSRFADEFRRLISANDIIPGYLEFVLASHESFIGEHPDVLRAFLYAYDKSMNYTRDNLEEAAAIWGKRANLDTEVVLDGMKHLPAGVWTADLLPEALKTIEQTMRKFEFIDKSVKWNRLVVQDFLPPERRVTF